MQQNYACDVGTDMYKSNKKYWYAYLDYNVDSVHTLLYIHSVNETVNRKRDMEGVIFKNLHVISSIHNSYSEASLLEFWPGDCPAFLKFWQFLLRLALVTGGISKLRVIISIEPQKNMKVQIICKQQIF